MAAEIVESEGITDPPAEEVVVAEGEKPEETATGFLSDDEGTKPEDKSGTLGKPAEASADIEVKFPEGFEADELLVTSLKEVAKAKQLTADEVGKLATSIATAQDNLIKGIVEKDKAVKQGWEKQIAADKEIGGVNLKESMQSARRALKRFDPDGELVGYLKAAGLTNQPGLVRTFVRIGKAMAEDKISSSNSNGRGKEPDPEEKALREMYPSMYSETQESA